MADQTLPLNVSCEMKADDERQNCVGMESDEELCSSSASDAYRDNSCTTSDRFVRILNFRHFERFFRFDQSDRKTYKKAISDGVNVSVVLDCGFGNTSKEK